MTAWQLEIISEFHRRIQHGVVINRTFDLCRAVYERTGLIISDRHMLNQLHGLETMRVVYRPFGERSGWCLVPGHRVQLLLPFKCA